MRVKICGLFREQDIDYVNEGRPDYAGFVFTQSKRQVTPTLAQRLRSRLADYIIPVGVFVNSQIDEITALYKNGVISIAQLHGSEDDDYITKLKEKNSDLPVIKVCKFLTIRRKEDSKENVEAERNFAFSAYSGIINNKNSDYILVDSGAGSGETFNWNLLKKLKIEKPWFLAGGINIKNVKQAMALAPFALDISSGAETDGIKSREKILQLITTVRKESNE
ncbi:MAG: phosphoribosylanthranilate isomerase [Treponema sp.]|nr:phosphoribosylanthranilate isomerase [Treponema sp.]